MKTFKEFLEEASNVIKKLHPWATKLVGKGGYNDSNGEWYYKTGRELFKKSKLSKDDKINALYKDITNPKKPSEADLLKGTGVLPITKA
tara:strand:- start:470 stop:736 length:267 start_codon:yes stop_codon:yes gene_type:complete